MNSVFTILTVLILIAAVLLIAVVLLQNGKGDGMASNFVAGNQTFGVRQTADLLEKISWGLATFILVVSVISAFTLTPSRTGDVTDKIQESVEQPAPEFPKNPAKEASPADSLKN